ncbi:MAG: protein translocase subunit SecF [Pyrinomonadaceae bacterium]
MVQLFKNVTIDWLAKRRIFITVSVLLMLVGWVSAVVRQATGSGAFNMGVDFKGGTVVTAEFKQLPTTQDVRGALDKVNVHEATIQPIVGKNQFFIRLPQLGTSDNTQDQTQVDAGRGKVVEALKNLGPQIEPDKDFNSVPDANAFRIIGTDAVGEIAGKELRNRAISVTLLALIGILVYIGYRFEWTYGAAAVIAVFHDVLVTLGIFSIFHIEVNLTVVAALLTLVGFSVNDTIVTFDRIRENLKLRRRDSLYDITNDSINQTLSRTVITSGLVVLSVIALVLFGGEVLRPFSLALFIGVVFGTYSSIAIASPIMVWWQQRIGERARLDAAQSRLGLTGGTAEKRKSKDAKAGVMAR